MFTTLNTNNNQTMIINNDSCTLNVPIISGLNVVRNQSWGAIQVSPYSDNYETGIAFSRYIDERITNAGDTWLIGNGFAGNPGVFSIFTNVINNVFTISSTGAITIPYSLTVNGTNIINKFNDFYNKATVDNMIITVNDTKIDKTEVNNLMYNTGGKNYIVAGSNTSSQLVMKYNGTTICDFDDGSATFYRDVIAPNTTQFYTINTGGTQQWISLGTLTTTQQGKHFVIRITYCGGYNASVNSSNTATIHFKSSNCGAPYNIGFTGNPFYGDLIIYSNGPEQSIRARAEQLDSGINFICVCCSNSIVKYYKHITIAFK